VRESTAGVSGMLLRVSPPLVVLRSVEAGDAEVYIRMRCDPAMMGELGGPRPRDEVLAKVQRDVARAQDDTDWILMIIPQATAPEVAGSVVVWTNREHGEPFTEIGWMVLPEFQGHGVAKAAVRTVLERARLDGRWGDVHAFPSVTNGPSNGICRSLGFALLGEESIEFMGQRFVSNHWVANPPALPDADDATART
jgi:RimJ/RimL family protein N-acetyltransferase